VSGPNCLVPSCLYPTVYLQAVEAQKEHYSGAGTEEMQRENAKSSRAS
jgi:hypothetical protein